MTSDNSGYTSNTVEISAKLNAAPATATVVTIKMVSTDAADDTTYTSGNTSGVPANPNEAPRDGTLALIEEFSTDAQGLAADIQSASNAQVSNSHHNKLIFTRLQYHHNYSIIVIWILAH